MRFYVMTRPLTNPEARHFAKVLSENNLDFENFIQIMDILDKDYQKTGEEGYAWKCHSSLYRFLKFKLKYGYKIWNEKVGIVLV